MENKIRLKNNYENLLIDEVEAIWEQIDKKNDWTFLETKIANIRKMGDNLGSKKLVNF
jgi:two-component SAPR family response regulator